MAGECSHWCVGCWARVLADWHKWSKYQGKPRVDEKQIDRCFKAGDFVFVQDMTDLFAEDVQREVVFRVLKQIGGSPDAEFLLLTKNPKRYFDFLADIPDNCILGATIESDRGMPRNGKAPNRQDRLLWMQYIKWVIDLKWTKDALYTLGYDKPRMFVSVEPILDFNLEEFSNLLWKWLRPWAVAVGYDNYGNGFPEPPLPKTLELIEELEFGHSIKVYRKTLRDPQIPKNIKV